MLTSARDRANLDSDFSQKGWCHFETSARSSDDARPRQEGAIEPQMQTPARSCDGAISKAQQEVAMVPDLGKKVRSSHADSDLSQKVQWCQTSAKSCDRVKDKDPSKKGENCAISKP